MNNKTLEIHYRTYRDSDAVAVRELFKNSITVGEDSPMVVALRAQFTSPAAFALYTLSALGVYLAVWAPTIRIRYLGFFFCLLSTATFAFCLYTRFYSFKYFAEYAGTSDLGDVPRAYGLTREETDQWGTGTGMEKGEYVANGPNGFWVAEVYHPEGMYPEVVGCVGLDTSQMNARDNAIELRRMAVSSKYRRRGIASRLINIAVAHARAHGKSCIDLTTSSYQESALGLYEKHGWVVRSEWVLMLTNLYTHQLRRYLN